MGERWVTGERAGWCVWTKWVWKGLEWVWACKIRADSGRGRSCDAERVGCWCVKVGVCGSLLEFAVSCGCLLWFAVESCCVLLGKEGCVVQFALTWGFGCGKEWVLGEVPIERERG